MAFLDFSNGYEVPGHELATSGVQVLSEMCCAIVGFDNDIMSHWKETLRSGDGINLVDVLVRQHGLTPAAALQEAVALRDRVLARFLDLREQAVPMVSAATRRYLGGLAAWVRGNVDWGMKSPRYVNPDDLADLPSAPVTTDPGPVPGVEWWWQVGAPSVPSSASASASNQRD